MLISEVYRALGDDSRLRIMNALQYGVFNVRELTALLGLSQPTVSHHLKVLSQSGLVTAAKNGTWAYYRLARDGASKPVPSSIVHNLLSLLAHEEHFTTDNSAIRRVLDERRDQAKAFFDSAASEWSHVRSQIQGGRSYFAEVAELFAPTETLLELGCGSGALLDAILPRPGTTIAVDYSEAMLESAKRTLKERASNVDFRLGYLEHLPLGDESVDVAVSYMVLHHVTEPKRALADMHRVLLPGGRIAIVELTHHAREEMRERYADLWLGFEPQELSQWAVDVGFSDPRIATLDGNGAVFLLTAVKQKG